MTRYPWRVHRETQDRWRAFQKCPPTPVTLAAPDRVHTVAYRGCRDGTETVFTTIDGLGHVWPGARDPIDATAVIWEFFRSHPRT